MITASMTSVTVTSAYAAPLGENVLVGKGDGRKRCHSTYISI